VSTDALFDVTPLPVASAPKLTPGQKRRARQDEAVAHGQHPLSVALQASIRLHPDAGQPDGPTCGSCYWRDAQNLGTASTFPKCWLPDGQGRHPRITRGPGTDVKRAWPGCADHKAKDPPP
jgi:hypothetical protein